MGMILIFVTTIFSDLFIYKKRSKNREIRIDQNKRKVCLFKIIAVNVLKLTENTVHNYYLCY